MNQHASGLNRRSFLSLVAAALLETARAGAQDLSCGAPPPAQPQRIKGGESFPPLPLPATPLRRTERKRPPSPPSLIAKLRYGQKKTAQTADGRSYEYFDWKSDPGDAAGLLRFANPKLKLNYREQVIGPQIDRLDPREFPILYITGHQRFGAPPGSHEQIYAYVAAGGTVVADACCGSVPFGEGFTEFIHGAFPNRRFTPLSSDHALFRAFDAIDAVTFQEGTQVVKKGPPEIFGVELGCRAAVLFSRYDLSCGWDSHVHDVGGRIEPFDAMRLGTNMLAYTLANQELGRFLAATKTYYESPSQTTGGTSGDEFVLGQLVHDGDWDPDPSAVANLLRAVETNSSVGAKFVRRQINAAQQDLFEVPFLYMTGHHAFTFSAQEAGNLKEYLVNGGFLLADACCGRKEFDEAFRNQLKLVIPNRELEPIPPDDPLYSCLYRIKDVGFSVSDAKAAPGLLGIKIDGVYAVVYSPVDLGNGWEGVVHPFVEGIAPEDSLRIGMNAILYALTH